MYSFFAIDGLIDAGGQFRILEFGRGLDSGFGIYGQVYRKKSLIADVVIPGLKKLGYDDIWFLGPLSESPSRNQGQRGHDETPIRRALGRHPSPYVVRKEKLYVQGDDFEFERVTNELNSALKRPSKGKGHLVFYRRTESVRIGYTESIQQALAGRAGIPEALTIAQQAASFGSHVEIADWPLPYLLNGHDKAFSAYIAAAAGNDGGLFPKTRIFATPVRYSQSIKTIAAEIRAEFGCERRIVLKPSNMGAGIGVVFANPADLETHLNDMIRECSLLDNPPPPLIIAQSFIDSPLPDEPLSIRKIFENVSGSCGMLRHGPKISENPHQRVIRLALSYIDGDLHLHGGFGKLLKMQSDGQLKKDDDHILCPGPDRLAPAEAAAIMEQIKAPLKKHFDFMSDCGLAQIIDSMRGSDNPAHHLLASEVIKFQNTLIPDCLPNSPGSSPSLKTGGISCG